MTQRYHLIAITILSIALVAGSVAGAAEIVLQPNGAVGKDSYVNANQPTTAHGSESYLEFGGYAGTSEYRLYIQFDLSALSPTTTIDNAQLEFYMTSQNGFMDYPYSVYPVTSAWSEGSLTWNNQPTRDGTAATTFSGATWQGGYGSWHTITGLGPIVQSWIADPSQNFGVVIQPTSNFYGYPMLASSDNGTATDRPRLVLNGDIVPADDSTWGGVKDLYR